MVERTMDNYIANLKKLVCDETNYINPNQVEKLVTRTIRKEHWVLNGNRPNGKNVGTGRVRDFLTDTNLKDPIYHSKSLDDGTTKLQRTSDMPESITLNNNPLYKPNMLDVLNTPFDHIERIVLQDLST